MKAKEMNKILADYGATKGPDESTSLVDLKILNVDLPEIQEINTQAIAKKQSYTGSTISRRTMRDRR